MRITGDTSSRLLRGHLTRRSFVGLAVASTFSLLARQASAAEPDSVIVEQPIGGPIDAYSSAAGTGSAVSSSARYVVTRYPTRTRGSNGSTSTAEPHWIPSPAGALTVPFVSQYDGTSAEGSNCGPASLSMVLAYNGLLVQPAVLRAQINARMGIWHVDNGSSWESLAYVAARYGLAQRGLYASKDRLRAWTFENLDRELAQESPVIVLVRFPFLPGRSNEAFQGNHYVVIVGFDRSGHYYFHDPATHDLSGAYRTITHGQLSRAWSMTTSGISHSGMALYWPA